MASVDKVNSVSVILVQLKLMLMSKERWGQGYLLSDFIELWCRTQQVIIAYGAWLLVCRQKTQNKELFCIEKNNETQFA